MTTETNDQQRPAPVLVSPADAGRLLGVSRTMVYELIAAGSLRVRKLGRRSLLNVDELRAFADSLEPAGKKSARGAGRAEG